MADGHGEGSGGASVRSRPVYWDDARLNGPSQPVVGVTWYEAVAYCRWLTAALNDGAVYRLPTEAEWERAPGPRGPCPSRGRVRVVATPGATPGSPERANTKELGLERTTPVGIFPHGRQRRRGAGPGRQRLGVVPRLVRREGLSARGPIG